MTRSPQEEYDLGAACFKAGNAAEGAEHLRAAAFGGHEGAQNQLARLYFARVKSRQDVADLEAAAQGGDHVALFVLAMCFIDGKIIDKDVDKAIAALQRAAGCGNRMAQSMLSSTSFPHGS